MRFQRLALIGCGLMGGSFALALREAGLVKTIVGFSASEKTRQRAVDLKVIDQACTSVAEAVQGADLVLLAVPVGAMHASFAAMRDALQPSALLMDVGSTKCDVIAAAQATLGERLSCFVPAHPIAGKEVAGIDHAEATLLQAWSITFNCTARSRVACEALKPTMCSTAPAWRNASANEPPIRPQPISASFLK